MAEESRRRPGHHLARQIEPDKRLLGLSKAMLDLAVNDESRLRGR